MWRELNAQASGALTLARLVAHWAAQIPAAAGSTLLEPAADWGHTALTWAPDSALLVGAELTGGVRAGLRLDSLELVVVAGDTIEARRALVGVRVDEGLSWLAEALARTLGGEAQPLSCPEHALPAHPVGDGGAFDIAGLEGHLGALAAWFGNAHDMLTDLVRDRSDGAPVRVWPHHFDIATLVTLADTGDAETSKSVSVGLSPGDDSYDEPYWYVSPWPYPDPRRDDLPIGAGHWHTDGFYAAVLTASEMGDADQANRARDFIDQAFAASVGLLS